MPDSLKKQTKSEKENLAFAQNLFGDKTGNLGSQQKKDTNQQQKQQAEPKQAAVKLDEDEIEVTGVVTRAEFDAANGDIGKIFNNNSSDMFLSEEEIAAQEARESSDAGKSREVKQNKQARPEPPKATASQVKKTPEVKQEKKREQAPQTQRPNTNKQEQKPQHPAAEPAKISPEVKQEVKLNENSTSQQTGIDEDATKRFSKAGTMEGIMTNENIQVTKIRKQLNTEKLKRRLAEKTAEPEAEKSVVKKAEEPIRPAYYDPDFETSDVDDDEFFEKGNAPAEDTADMEIGADEDDTATAILTAEVKEPQINICPILTCMNTGEKFYVNKSIFTIGHSPKCDLVIKQGGNTHTVSRRHATFYIKNEDVYLIDQSTNGTFIGSDPNDTENFIRMMKDQETQIKNGQYLMFANVLFKFENDREE